MLKIVFDHIINTHTSEYLINKGGETCKYVTDMQFLGEGGGSAYDAAV